MRAGKQKESAVRPLLLFIMRTAPGLALCVLAAALLPLGCSDQKDPAPTPTTAPLAPVVNDTDTHQGAPRPISYNRDIRPILSDKCLLCHGPDAGTRKAELRLDVTENGAGYAGAYFVIEPGDLENSELYLRIHSTRSSQVMPPPDFAVQLTDEEKALIDQWIREGAVYEDHWAFVPVQVPELPEVANETWSRNAIDRFVLAELERRDIEPSAQASLQTRVRRVSLDLVGLPPDPVRVQELLSADDPDRAYEAYVDELLASPRFGERMASIWLDASRYADTNGYLHDHRRTMWPWRDWVIRAYNDNMPYNVFLRDQIAGDLLPNPTPDQLIATGFNRNHGITTEGGSIDEEFLVEYAADRTNTLGTAVLALTIECSRCHDHKYDPITQDDYYSLFAYFNSLENEDPATNGRAPAHAPLIQDAASGQRVMIMRETATPRPTFVLERGQYDAPIQDRPVSRRVPLSLGQAPEGAPANRLGLAQWLTSPDNPLVARVEVNRIWQMLFGRGLVNTSEDFGLQGESPSHPELLDYLASTFVQSGWDRKALIRLIATSATYRQLSNARPELDEIDPQNRLLARMSRLRLPAETIRDQALCASGLLVNQLGGEGVRPYQPAGLWVEGANEGSNTRVFRASEGDGLYRRSVYTFWKRTAPPPQMVLFDAADRNACVVRRGTTNTALQALLLMNDEQHIEAARVLAARAWQSGTTDAQRLDAVYLLCLGRSPRDSEAQVLLAGIEHYRSAYAQDPEAAQALLAMGAALLPDTIEANELAAWTMIASTVLNLDETITRP